MKRLDSAFTWALATACAIVLLAYAGASKAAPFKVTDPVDARATHCGLYANGLLQGDFPVYATGSGNICRFDIAGQAAGSTVVYTATQIEMDATWGRNESPRSLPLSVARPAGLTVAPMWSLSQPAASSAPVRGLLAPAQATPAPR